MSDLPALAAILAAQDLAGIEVEAIEGPKIARRHDDEGRGGRQVRPGGATVRARGEKVIEMPLSVAPLHQGVEVAR